jgi:acetyltransferase-like isoleucine patch superfamily enzyme
MGVRVFIADRVSIARWSGSGAVELGDAVLLNREVTLELHEGGSVRIECEAGIQMRSHIKADGHPIVIGARAMLAPYCVLDSGFGHSALGLTRPMTAPQRGGPITIGDDTWLGTGAIVVGGVSVGEGAVIAAGALVTEDVPAGAIAVGSPARVVKYRRDLSTA